MLLATRFEHADPRPVPDDVGAHGQDEEPAFVVGPIELRGPDLVNVAGRRMGADGGEAVHPEVGVVVQDPFDGQLEDAARCPSSRIS
jgi:hypothetical protein